MKVDAPEFDIADLSQHSHLVKEMTELETRMREELGQQVNLIAYTNESAADS